MRPTLKMICDREKLRRPVVVSLALDATPDIHQGWGIFSEGVHYMGSGLFLGALTLDPEVLPSAWAAEMPRKARRQAYWVRGAEAILHQPPISPDDPLVYIRLRIPFHGNEDWIKPFVQNGRRGNMTEAGLFTYLSGGYLGVPFLVSGTVVGTDHNPNFDDARNAPTIVLSNAYVEPEEQS